MYKKIQNLIKKSSNILLISHRRPDPDTLGSALALNLYLKSQNKNTVLACIDKPHNDFSFLPHINEYVSKFKSSDFNLVFFLDAGDHKMTKFHITNPELFTKQIPVINIDHHASNDFYGTINIVDTSAASTTVLITELLQKLKSQITPSIATCLMTGLYSDTGSFMHSNTDRRALETAAILSKKGADIETIRKQIFTGKDIDTLHLWGKALEKTTLTENSVAISILSPQDIEESNNAHCGGVVDYINMVKGSKFAILLKVDKNENIKGSLRTENEKINLSKLANKFGGGGHRKAAGFFIKRK